MKQIEGMAVARAFFSVMNLTNLYKFSRNIDDEGPIREFDSDSQAGTTAKDEKGAFLDDGELIYSRDWNGLYTQREIDYLDDYYAKLEEGFVLDNQNIQDYARKAAKASLDADIKYSRMRHGQANQAAQSLKEGVGELAEGEDALAESSQTAEKKMAALGTELNAAKKSSSAKYFKNTAKAIEELKHGAVSVSDAFGTYNKEEETAVKANEEYQAASKKMAAGTKVAASEIDTLSEYLGNINPQILLANWDQVGPMLASALAEGEDAFRRLNEAAFISITGTSVADFSALTSGLISVQNLAADAVDALIATGQWTMETITMPQEGAQWNPLTGVWTRTRINTNQNVLRYTGSNPLKGGGSGKKSSGRGGKGGGGSGSSSTSVSQSTQKLLDKMDEAVDAGDHRRKMAQLAQQYHEVRGEIQGVILYLGKEKEIVQENSTTLTGYISELENQMAAQRAIMSKNKEGSKKYKQAATDLEALQKQHQQYSETLLQNKIDLEELTKAIKEQQDAIRDMEIGLRDLIHDAILDREALNKRMLEGQIDVENELIDVITRRYEKERDQLIELAEANAFPDDAEYAIKFIKKASGRISGKEVAIEAKESSIASLQKQLDKTTDETKRQGLQEQITALELGI